MTQPEVAGRRLLRAVQRQEQEARSHEARERHRQFRMVQEFERQRERLKQPLGVRLDAALRRASALSDASAAELEQSHSGKPQSSPPPSTNGLLRLVSNEDVGAYFSRRLRLMIQALEREVDSHLMRPISADLGDELAEERDRRLVSDFAGMSPAEVSFIDPSMGSPRAVERARLRCMRNPSDGSVRE